MVKLIAFVLVALLGTTVAGAQPAISPQPSIFTSAIPFTDCHNLICTQVSVAGKGSFTFLFDTSNAQSAVDTASAQAMGLHLDPYVGRAGKPIDGVFSTVIPTVTLGKVTGSAVKAIVVDFNSSLKNTNLHLDGSLAYPFFKDRIVQINYASHTVRISEPMTTTWACNFHCSAMKLVTFGKNGPPILASTFSINGRPITAQVDTSFEGSMLIYPHAVAGLGLAKIAQRTKPRFFPVTDGGVTMLAAAAHSMSFAGLPLGGTAPTVYFATKGVHAPDGMFEATVGNELFKNMILTLDFHDMVLSVNPAN